jgi:TetR/AcrR family transcriptional regulator of autoinduction and epiphytic fitness
MSSPPATRKEQAAATRARIRSAAAGLFAERGYARTTMEVIAKDAGVALPTVYFVFHTKPELFAEVLRVGGGAPGDPIEVVERPWVQEVMAEPDPTRMVALLVDHGSDIFTRIAPLTAAMMAAAADDEDVGELVRGIVAGRRAGQRGAIEVLAAKGGLREDVSVQTGADILYALQSAPLYQVLTAECGWSPQAYKAWLFDTLVEGLLSAPASTPEAIGRALAGRSFEGHPGRRDPTKE